jgi:hypothetical protein
MTATTIDNLSAADVSLPTPGATVSDATCVLAIAAFTATYAISNDARFADFLAFLRETGAGEIAADEEATRLDVATAALVLAA